MVVAIFTMWQNYVLCPFCTSPPNSLYLLWRIGIEFSIIYASFALKRGSTPNSNNPLFEWLILLAHICVTQHLWVNVMNSEKGVFCVHFGKWFWLIKGFYPNVITVYSWLHKWHQFSNVCSPSPEPFMAQSSDVYMHHLVTMNYELSSYLKPY